MTSLVNGLSIDVEEYFQVEAAAGSIPPSTWERWPSRVEPATHRILALLAETGCRATFFALGWVAERHRGLVRAIAEAGHEVGCHGHAHRHIARVTPAAFRADVRRAKRTLEDAVGRPVLGFRAPTFSIRADTLWALDVLVEEGFLYDSSIFPVHHDRYGLPGAPRWPHVLDLAAGRLVELPPLTARVAGATLPLAGGGYLRLLTAAPVLWGIRAMNRSGRSAVIYVHPWEVDPGQPTLPMRLVDRWRHRVGLRRTVGQLRRLLGACRFGPLIELARALADRKPVARSRHPRMPTA